MKIHIYHHYDLDGYGAAAVIKRHFVDEILRPSKFCNDYNNFEYYVCNHNSNMDFSKVNENDLIFIVDYSFNDQDKENIIEIYETLTQNIVWIDHHKTSENIINEDVIFQNIAENGLVETSNRYSGCLLAYIWCKHLQYNMLADVNNKCEGVSYHVQLLFIDLLLNSKKEVDLIKNGSEETVYKYCPEWVQLVSDYDTFRHKLPDSVAYNSGANSIGLFDLCLNEDTSRECDITRVESIVKHGSIILKHQEGVNKKLIKNNSFVTHLVIHKKDGTEEKKDIVCVNGYGNSMVFGDLYNQYDAVSIFNFNGDNFKYSMFSKKDGGMDCSIVALYYKFKYKLNGGGHLHAAGWSSPEMVFKKDQIVHIYEQSFM